MRTFVLIGLLLAANAFSLRRRVTNRQSLVARDGEITLPGVGSNSDPEMAPANPLDLKQVKGALSKKMGKIHNDYGKYLNDKANAMGVTEDGLAAVLAIESGGQGFDGNGRMMIRFENHVFYKQYTADGSDATKVATFDKYFKFNKTVTYKGHMWRQDENSEWVSVHPSKSQQDMEWKVLQFAQSLDDTAALSSISMGGGQIMGYNFPDLGYPNVQDMFKAFSVKLSVQFDALVSFINAHSRCKTGLQTADYVLFALCYNGKGKKEKYGADIKAAADAYAALFPEIIEAQLKDLTEAVTNEEEQQMDVDEDEIVEHKALGAEHKRMSEDGEEEDDPLDEADDPAEAKAESEDQEPTAPTESATDLLQNAKADLPSSNSQDDLSDIEKVGALTESD
jgi:hypothetical protein